VLWAAASESVEAQHDSHQVGDIGSEDSGSEKDISLC